MKASILWRDGSSADGIAHGAPVYFCGPPGRPANHFGDVILEAGWRHLVVGFVHSGVRIEAGVGHDAVDKFIDTCGLMKEPPRRS